MASASGIEPQLVEHLASLQGETPINRTNISIDHYQQVYPNPSKRSKGGDDSFEREHRLGVRDNKYFYDNNNQPSTSTLSSTRAVRAGPNESASQATFPPFKINFDSDEVPSELAIIKDINKQCKISLSFGRYSRFGNKKSFLLYANSNDQFERLLDKKFWPKTICSTKYSLDAPSKVPASYSLIATGIPAQWDLSDFASDVKRQYPSIIKVERMLVRGGIPIAKVRIDFSSKVDMQSILKNNRILLDDENTSFPVQQYFPPFKILRCYNCQRYNDHVAANCPHKDNPVCFRCGQNHPYNPNCTNRICCANCKEEHLAGNPNRRVKIEERSKCKAKLIKPNDHQPHLTNASPAPWSTTANQILTMERQPPTIATTTTTSGDNSNFSPQLEISKKLDLILSKIDNLAVEHNILKTNLNNVNHQLLSCQETISSLKIFISEQICPLLLEVGEGVMGKKGETTKKLRPLIANFSKCLDALTKSIGSNANQLPSSTLSKSSSHESISEDF